MADDFQDKLNGILNNPELMKTISTLAGNMSNPQPTNNTEEMYNYPKDISSELSTMASAFSDSNDSRINLLYALKPYMRSARADQMDMAIKLLRLTKLTTLL